MNIIYEIHVGGVFHEAWETAKEACTRAIVLNKDFPEVRVFELRQERDQIFFWEFHAEQVS